MEKPMIVELVARAFNARNIAHKEHWQTRSYSAHVALGAFYDDVIEAIDALVENYIGMFGPLDDLIFDGLTDRTKDIQGFLQDECDWIETNIMELSQGSDSIANLIQSLVSVYTKAVFLLRLR